MMSRSALLPSKKNNANFKLRSTMQPTTICPNCGQTTANGQACCQICSNPIRFQQPPALPSTTPAAPKRQLQPFIKPADFDPDPIAFIVFGLLGSLLIVVALAMKSEAYGGLLCFGSVAFYVVLFVLWANACRDGKRAAIAAAWKAYTATLSDLSREPGDRQLRQHALGLGRHYWGMCGRTNEFTEIRIMNDINAACGSAKGE